jgi:hypothetical protein
MPRFSFGLGVLALFAVTACKDDLDPERLWDSLDSPDQNKLRGVYQLLTTDGNSNIEIRLRFTDHTVVGAVRCAPKNPKYEGVEATGTAQMGTNDLDAATGKFDVDALAMSKSQDPIFCEGGLAADTYDFKVEGLRLTLNRPKITEPIIYTKIGQ